VNDAEVELVGFAGPDEIVGAGGLAASAYRLKPNEATARTRSTATRGFVAHLPNFDRFSTVTSFSVNRLELRVEERLMTLPHPSRLPD